jgi:hypothetical protein
MAVSFNKFYDFSQQLVKGVHSFGTHVFKVALTNTAPSATDVSWLPGTTAPPPAAVFGYTAGGNATTVTETDTTGTTTVQGTQVVFTAAGGNLGPFRYAILYNDTATVPTKAVVGYFDYGSSITLADTESLTIQFNSTTPGTILTVA